MEESMASTSCSSSSTALNVLPPCKVCGERASGLHYGINTCEGCKSFFKRCLLRKSPPNCKLSGKCSLTQQKRKHVCGGCRYAKCLLVGMSKQSIRNGRYTLEKVTQDIHEVRRLQMQARMDKSRKSLLTAEDRQRELDDLIDYISEPSMAKVHHFVARCNMQERESKFLETRSLRKHIFGLQNPLTLEEYKSIYHATGLDVDGRKAMLDRVMPAIQNCLVFYKDFVSRLPGFADMPRADKQVLLAESFTYFHIFMYYHVFNCDECVFVEFEITAIVQPSRIDRFCEIHRRLQELQLTKEEQYLLTGYALMSQHLPTMSTEGQQYMEASHEVLHDTLRRLLQRNHEDDAVCSRLFYRAHHILVDMQNVIESCKTDEQNLFQDLFGLRLPVDFLD